jgi:nitrate reductase delta subunit
MQACDRIAAALSYPCTNFRAVVEECERAVAAVDGDAADHVARFRHATAEMSAAALQELYSQTFDMDPRCALDVGWHVFGESYDRSAFLAMLREDLRVAEVPSGMELPDHITHMLRLIGRLNDVRAGECGALIGVALDRILETLAGSGNPYEHLLRAVGTLVRPAPARAAEAQRGRRR